MGMALITVVSYIALRNGEQLRVVAACEITAVMMFSIWVYLGKQ
jgi:hypothetical protein